MNRQGVTVTLVNGSRGSTRGKITKSSSALTARISISAAKALAGTGPGRCRQIQVYIRGLQGRVSVISPTPDGPAGGPATGAYLTLTTCHPKFSAHQRLIIHARLDGAPLSKAAAPNGPAALAG